MIILIIFFLFLISYAYFIYPLLLRLVNVLKLKTQAKNKVWKELPTVTLLIAAHNEEDSIASKLENALALDYPMDKLQILVATDGCTDNTVEIIKSFGKDGVELFEQKEHSGKICARNKAMEIVHSEFVVFSDANGMYKSDAIKQLMRHFTDEKIGCVCGNLVLSNPQDKTVGDGETLYWRYEKWIRKQESDFNSIIVANGSIFAIRRELYTPLELDITDDLATPLLIYRKGYRAIYEAEAKSFEETNENTKQGFSRKDRVILRQLVTLKRYFSIIKPFSGVLGIQIVSHKVLRWLVPIWQIGIILANLFILTTKIGVIIFIGQIFFYGAAVAGGVIEKRGKNSGILKIVFYFCMMNIASLKAIFRFLAGKTQAKWKIAR